MTRGEAVNWLTNIMSDIGKIEHQDLWHYEQALSEIRELLEAQPERKTGRWIEQDDGWGGIYWKCSKCGAPYTFIDGSPSDNEYNYCPNCGLPMIGGDDNAHD